MQPSRDWAYVRVTWGRTGEAARGRGSTERRKSRCGCVSMLWLMLFGQNEIRFLLT